MAKKTKNKIKLQPISKSDLILLRDWRNSMEIFPYNTQFFLLNLKIQKNWFKKLQTDKSRKMFIVLFEEKKIGVCGLIHIDYLNKNADIAIIIGDKNFHGKGIGSFTLDKLLKYGFKKLKLHRIGAEVIEYNLNSIRLFEKFNFKIETTFRDMIWRKNRWWNMKSFYLIQKNYQPIS